MDRENAREDYPLLSPPEAEETDGAPSPPDPMAAPDGEDDTTQEPPPGSVEPDTAGRPRVSGFAWRRRGLYSMKPGGTDGEGNPRLPKMVWIAPPFSLPGLVRDGGSGQWQVLFAWHDLDAVPHEEALAVELITGEGAELARKLGQGGLVLSPEPSARKALLRYLCGAIPQVRTRVRLVDALGWQGGAFVLPGGETIGQPPEPVRYAGDAPGLRSRATAGSLIGWQQGVARYAVGNSRLAFSLACAFAGPLLRMVRPDGAGGFNLQGASSKGKSTCLEVASSVWQNPEHLSSWRTTSNGLEGIAAARNDGFLALDELGQVDAKDAGPAAYMLANGSAKARMTRDGGNRPIKQWRLIFLSSGEQGLEDKLSEDGKRPKPGQDVRVPDIPCPSNGMLDDAHGFPGHGHLAEHLKAQARQHYGHAARAFLKALCDESTRSDVLEATLKSKEAAWLTAAVPGGADPQVRRVAGRFALVAVAGELAQRMEILPWPEGEAEHAALVCFKAWLDRRGFTGASEDHGGVEAVLAFIGRHGLSRFDEWGDRDAKIINRAGTRKRVEGGDGWDYYLTSEAWKEACQGFTPKDVARACVEAGIIEPGRDGKNAQSVSVPGHGKARCYVIRANAVSRHPEGGGS